jgi:hypothetical protein
MHASNASKTPLLLCASLRSPTPTLKRIVGWMGSGATGLPDHTTYSRSVARKAPPKQCQNAYSSHAKQASNVQGIFRVRTQYTGSIGWLDSGVCTIRRGLLRYNYLCSVYKNLLLWIYSCMFIARLGAQALCISLAWCGYSACAVVTTNIRLPCPISNCFQWFENSVPNSNPDNFEVLVRIEYLGSIGP